MSYQPSNSRAAYVVIDSAAIEHNLKRVTELVPSAKVMAVIKADGYGHGMEVAAKALANADEFAVSSLDDVARLRSQGFDKPITMLSATFDVDDLNIMSAQKVRPVIYDLAQLAIIAELSETAELDLWLKIDTGMGRLGLCIDDAHLMAARLLSQAGVNSVSAMTHLANADDPDHPNNQRQIKSFLKFAEPYNFSQLSIMNSAGTVAFRQQANSMVRPGLILYGVSPQLGGSAQSLDLRPAMTLKSKLISVKRLPVGSPIGYGSRYVLDADSRIGVISCGYADGYPRHAPSGTPVLVNGLYVPLIGRVSMDLITVDLGEVRAEVGDDVILWGADNPVEVIAEMSGTIAYELICGITPRVERLVI
ncbi:MAG: alanine racemase [Arenicella sp.]|nr:alanine racemase [Arenicella sp.]